MRLLPIKTEQLLTGILLIVLCLSLLVYTQTYVDDINANPNISDPNKALITYVPTLLIMFIIAIAAMLLYGALKKR